MMNKNSGTQVAWQQKILAGAGTKPLRPLMSQTDREWLEYFETHVRRHYADDTLNVPGLAREFAMSESTLLRQLKRLTGLSPVQYLQHIRLGEARRLLENCVYNSIAKVASKVGYQDVRSFSRRFRAQFGKLPSEVIGEGKIYEPNAHFYLITNYL